MRVTLVFCVPMTHLHICKWQGNTWVLACAVLFNTDMFEWLPTSCAIMLCRRGMQCA